MRDSQTILVEFAKQAQNKGYQFERIYRVLCNPKMYIKAYSNIYSETADGFNETKINNLTVEKGIDVLVD